MKEVDKSNFVVNTLKNTTNNIFIETGTWRGLTTSVAAKAFKKVYTIEVVESIYLQARENLRDFTNIVQIHGDSGEQLAKLLSTINEPCVAFIDAHLQPGFKENGDYIPVYNEIDALVSHSYLKNFIIDDAKKLISEHGITLEEYLRQNGIRFQYNEQFDCLLCEKYK